MHAYITDVVSMHRYIFKRCCQLECDELNDVYLYSISHCSFAAVWRIVVPLRSTCCFISSTHQIEGEKVVTMTLRGHNRVTVILVLL